MLESFKNITGWSEAPKSEAYTLSVALPGVVGKVYYWLIFNKAIVVDVEVSEGTIGDLLGCLDYHIERLNISQQEVA